MQRWTLTLLVLALIVTMPTGCATSTGERQNGAQATMDRVCVRVDQITGFEPLDNRHVVVEARVNDHYLFTVDRACSGLSFARTIAISGTISRVCNDGFDFLAFEEPGVGSKRCRIIDIEPVEDTRAARALIESRSSEE